MSRIVELRFADRSTSRVPYDVLLQGWLDWVTAKDWSLDPMRAAAVALSLPDRQEGAVIAELRAECRRRLGLEVS
jgi:hypothetical protein